MCGTRRALRRAPSEGPYQGGTIRLSATAVEARPSCRPGGFPWWTLWMLPPMLAGLKRATAFAGPLLTTLLEPMTLIVAPLALLLIGAGLALLLVGPRRSGRENDGAGD